MTITNKKNNYWKPEIALTNAEKFICTRLKRTGKLFVFLRHNRDKIFNESFQDELNTMYSSSPRGKSPIPAAQLAMVTLLQAYEQTSDAAAVEDSVFDKRWQMVLGCLGSEIPPFSQGVLVEFRARLIAYGLDKRLLERTVELAKESGDFGYKNLRIALDSAPLSGAGRVEDTYNLIGHALEIVLECSSIVSGISREEISEKASLKLLNKSSIKAALDIDWSNKQEKDNAINQLLKEVSSLRDWIKVTLKEMKNMPPLRDALALLEQLIEQDIEPDPERNGSKIKDGVAKDRIISLQDQSMRHGRKSKSKKINGYKRHIAKDIDSDLILAAAVRPANEPEHFISAELKKDVERFGKVDELHIDRGYLAGSWANSMSKDNKIVYSKPWRSSRKKYFVKEDFKIDLAANKVTCPQGKQAHIKSNYAKFLSSDCHNCPLKIRCTKAKKGRTISIHSNETLLIKLRELSQTPEGREKLRERTSVEHSLAHVCNRQGARARYIGLDKNNLDIRRVAAINNLHTLMKNRCIEERLIA